MAPGKKAASVKPRKVRQIARPVKFWTSPVMPETIPQAAHMTQISIISRRSTIQAKKRLTDSGPFDLGGQHVGGDLEGDVTGKQNGHGGAVLGRSQFEILGDTSQVGGSNVLSVNVVP